MNLELRRRWFSDKSTLGELFIDGDFECFTLEDPVRSDPNPATPENEGKVYGETAIPPGEYPVLVSYSNRFKKRLPILMNVPGYSGVRIHCGNYPKDTLGCVLVGESLGKDSIGNSRSAFDKLFPQIDAAAKKEKVTLTIKEIPV